MQEMRVQSLGLEDPLEKEMTIHSSILAWEIPWTEVSVGLLSVVSMGTQRAGHDLATKQRQLRSITEVSATEPFKDQDHRDYIESCNQEQTRSPRERVHKTG